MGAGDVLAATAVHWDVSGPLPLPIGDWLACPVCRSPKVLIRFWRYHERSAQPTVPHRCDVSMKCAGCAAVWIHGVAIDAEVWARRKPKRLNVLIHWREGSRILEQHETEGSP